MKEIPLTQGKVALVDDEDFEYLSQWEWFYHEGYAVRTERHKGAGSSKIIRMHREILKDRLKPDDICDHANRNGCDNRKLNLRVCTRKENCRNRKSRNGASSRFLGVCVCNGKFLSQICVDGKNKKLGYFLSEEDAAVVYNRAAREHFKEFANLNPVADDGRVITPTSKPLAKSGLRGAYQHGTRWRSQIYDRRVGKFVNLGLFDTPEEAHQAYLKAKQELNQTK